MLDFAFHDCIFLEKFVSFCLGLYSALLIVPQDYIESIKIRIRPLFSLSPCLSSFIFILRVGQFAVTGANDKQMILWSLAPNTFGQVVKRMPVHTSEVICCAFTHDSTRIVGGTHAGVKQLHVWDFMADNDQ